MKHTQPPAIKQRINKRLKAFLMLGFITSLNSPKIQVIGIPLVFILPIFFSFLLIHTLNYRVNKDSLFLIGTISLVSFLMSWNLFDYKITLSSFSIQLASFLIFIIYFTAFERVLSSCNAKKVLFFLNLLLVLCIVEIFFPALFLKLRNSIYPNDYLVDFTLRDQVFMLGVRPMLFFNENSHLAKLLAILWLMYSFSSKHSVNSLLYFFIIFILLRSPTLFIISPILLFHFKNLTSKSTSDKALLVSILILGLLAVSYVLWHRISAITQLGSGSLQERIYFPLLYLINDWEPIFGYPIAGHNELYEYVCHKMALTRDHWDCSTKTAVASSSSLLYLGLFGIMGTILLTISWVTKYSLKGFYLIFSFFLSQIFLTGFNTPGTLMIVAFVISSILMSYKSAPPISRTFS